MQDRGAGLGGVDRLGRDLIGRDRQRVRHGRGMDRAGDGAGDDDLVGEVGHRRLLVWATLVDIGLKSSHTPRSFPRKRESSLHLVWVPAFAGTSGWGEDDAPFKREKLKAEAL